MRVLGLDISTTTVGWAIVESDDMSLVALGHWSLKKLYGLPPKADHVLEQVAHVINLHGVKGPVWVEEPVMRFTPGMSSAQTISLLIGFNAMVSYGIHLSLNFDVKHVPPQEARKNCGLTLQSKKKTGLSQKEQVYNKLTAPGDLLSGVSFPLTKTGKPKPENYDETDAYVVARHGALSRRA
jgi:hypothetical protein